METATGWAHQSHAYRVSVLGGKTYVHEERSFGIKVTFLPILVTCSAPSVPADAVLGTYGTAFGDAANFQCATDFEECIRPSPF